MYGFELYQNRKNAAKLNLCDNSVFYLMQNGYRNAKEIAGLLNIFSYSLLAESFSKLHNLQLIEINLSNGDIRLTEEVKLLLNKLNEVAVSNDILDDKSTFEVFRKNIEIKGIMRYFKGCIRL